MTVTRSESGRTMSTVWRTTPFLAWALAVVAVAVVNFGSGRLGLLLATPPGFATAMFPPAGIALGVLLAFGLRLWPGVFLGSLAINVTISPGSLDAATWAVSASIAGGSTLQAIASTCLIRRLIGYPAALDTGSDVTKALLLAGPVGCLVAATFGVFTLWFAGIVPATAAPWNWVTWWVGDTLGALVFAPAVLLVFGEPRAVWRSRRLTVGLPLAIVFGLSIVAFEVVERTERVRLVHEFEREAGGLAQTIESRLASYSAIGAAIASLYDSSERVTRDEFRAFVARSLEANPGILALDWAPSVHSVDRESFENEARGEAVTETDPKRASALARYRISEPAGDGAMMPATVRERYFPVQFTEPLAGNEHILGFDLGSRPARLRTLIAARDSGEPRATSPIELVGESERSRGFLLVNPVYATGGVPPTLEARRAALQGFVLGVFRFADIVEQALPEFADSNVMLRVEDEHADPGRRTLFQIGVVPGEDDTTRPQHEQRFEFAGRSWRIRFAPTDTYLATRQSSAPYIALAGGLLFTSLVGGFLLLLTGRMGRVESLVAQRTSALLAAEQRQRVLIESAPYATLLVEPDGTISLASEQVRSLLGYGPEELVGRQIDLLVPELAYNVQIRGRVGRDLHAVRKDGESVPIEIALSPMETPSGAATIAAIIDVSEREEAARALATRTEALARANDELARSNRDMHDFAYVASHDLRAPLQAVDSLASWIVEDVGDELPEASSRHLEQLQQRVRRMEQLLEDLLQYSRAGRVLGEEHDVDLGVLVDEIRELISPPARFEIRADSSMPIIRCHRTALRQVLQNLIGNAIKHHDAERGRVEVSCRDAGESVELTVRDDGPGIAPEFHERVFGMFQTLRSRDEVEGSGIGLAIVRRIVDSQGGDVLLASAVGSGTTIRFTWPKRPPVHLEHGESEPDAGDRYVAPEAAA